MLLLSRLALALAFVLGVQAAAADQQAKPAEAKTQQKPAGMQMSVVTLTVIVKDAIIALHQANLTGNYSVLRDMGTPVFRENFDQAALAAAFANLRARKIDLSPAYFLSPNLTKAPELNKDNELVVTGFFPTQPLQIQFELRFMQLDGRWRLAGMGVDAVAPPGPQASAAAPPPPASSPPAPAQQPASSQPSKKATGKPKS
jgi:hypothetical protein